LRVAAEARVQGVIQQADAGAFVNPAEKFLQAQAVAVGRHRQAGLLLEQQADDSIPPVFRSDTIRWLLANGDPTPGERARLEALLPPTGNND